MADFVEYDNLDDFDNLDDLFPDSPTESYLDGPFASSPLNLIDDQGEVEEVATSFLPSSLHSSANSSQYISVSDHESDSQPSVLRSSPNSSFSHTERRGSARSQNSQSGPRHFVEGLISTSPSPVPPQPSPPPTRLNFRLARGRPHHGLQPLNNSQRHIHPLDRAFEVNVQPPVRESFVRQLPLPRRRRTAGEDLAGIFEDELIEMEVEDPQASRRRPDFGTPLAPVPRQPTVIDLTDEPDSPSLISIPRSPVFRPPSHPSRSGSFQPPPQPITQASQASQSSQQQSQHRNPRRQMSLSRRTPSLTRSDGSLLGAFGGRAPVIDLTDDSPESLNAAPDPPRDGPGSRPAPNNPPNANPRVLRGGGGGGGGPDIAMLGFFRQFTANEDGGFARALHRTFHGLQAGYFGHRHVDVEVQYIGHNPNINNPLADHPVQLNYQANGFNQRVASPKPAYEPPPPPRDGFTRSTGEDIDAICPSCEEELMYNPDDGGEEGPPTKRPRTRKDREEHHFWAVKACGHVYCKSCYHNRKELAKTSTGAFRLDPGPKNGKSRKVYCAVEACGSDVSTTTAWVGIFL